MASSQGSHLKTAIAADHPDLGLGASKLRTDGSRQRKTHSPQTARGYQRAGLIVVIVLRFPHLVLAHVANHQRLAIGFPPEIVDHVRGVELAQVRQVLDVAYRRIALQLHKRDLATHRDRWFQPWAAIQEEDLRADRPPEQHQSFTFLPISERVDLNMNFLGA